MNIEDVIRTGLHEATDELEPSAELLSTVRRRSRNGRIKSTAAITGVAAVLAAGGIMVGVPHIGRTTTVTGHLSTVDQQLLRGPTEGNLAHNSDFVQKAKDLMQDWRAKQPPKGGDWWVDFKNQPEPHVAWAATTGDGRAAVVAQQAYLNDGSGTKLVAVLGFVGPGKDGQPVLVAGPTPSVHGGGATDGFFVKKSGRTVVVVQHKTASYMSLTQSRDPNGAPRRTYQRVPFVHAIAVVHLPSAAKPNDFMLDAAPGNTKDVGPVVNAPTSAEPTGSTTAGTMDWPNALWRIGKPDPYWPTERNSLITRFQALDHSTKVLDTDDQDAWQGGEWHLYGTLPDGNHIVVTDIRAYKAAKSYTVATITTPHGTSKLDVGAEPNAKSPLPVQLKLSQHQGWVVAQRGATLSYRVGAGAWRDAQHNAALYPAAATAVRVQLHGSSKVVPLRK
jgi:hypothetical protein